ncbi:MAG: pyruvate decarboxylase [Gammaproteobacteria bacterium RIFOXYA12_FULL_61_12]|nr:MAG: pyruvate decarboxylase [Gammaproteobacteria bacterium RIFOXYD12_FULL_61_37]OGT93399.1 MAG: pyruvate decarboxylase [Gammaproteobacteria bacterium RIFOXYA12_FULL_61_12]
MKKVTALTDRALPALPAAIRDAEASKEAMRNLRHFHLGNPQARALLQPAGEDSLPALLAPFRDSSRLRFDYPLFLRPAPAGSERMTPEQLAVPLSQALREAAEAVDDAQGGASVAGGRKPEATAARILLDNLPWMERELRHRLEEQEGPVAAAPLLAESCKNLAAHLNLDPENTARLVADLDRMRAALPASGMLLGYGRYPAIHLLIHSIRNLLLSRQARFREETGDAIQGLRRLLDVEKEKSAEATSAAKLAAGIGGAGSLLNPEALSGMMEHRRGSVSMPEQRQRRITEALATLESFQDGQTLVHLVHSGRLTEETWLARTQGLEPVMDADPSERATALFDREAGRLAKVFAAARIARLEIDNIYDSAIHDPWFAGFGWEAFSKDELQLVPAVIALEDSNRLAGEGMASFSRLLSSGRPVQILARVLAHNNPGRREGEGPFQSFRTELGYLGIGHRQAFIAQTSAARHNHLISGFLDALNATRTSLHLINTGLKTAGRQIALNAWLVAGAALEGRVHPFFRVNPGRGDSFAERMDFEGNPQPGEDWPLHTFNYQDEDNQVVETRLAFTFADYALLLPELRDEHFVSVPPQCESNDLVPLAGYLQKSQAESPNYVPFVWAVDKEGTLRRLVVSRTLVHACRDRLNYWHALQEMAGVRNRYVELAIEKAQAEIQAAADARIAEYEARHEQELADARSEAAGEVMGRLTDVLLGMDLSVQGGRMPGAATVARPAAKPKAEAVVEAAAAPAAVEEEPAGFDEPWIDTPLCTSCNDCMKVNPLMFVYNDTKQAVLGDFKSGTFAQMVEAASLCPSKCIHPGKPWNPGEPGLEELQQRAAGYN